MGAKHNQSLAQMLQVVDDQEVSLNRELTKVPVVQFNPGPNIHQIQSRGNPAAGTVFPINPHIDDRGVISDLDINVFIPHARHHYVKMSLTNVTPTIHFKKLFVGLSSSFTVDLTNGVALSSLTFDPVLSNPPTLDLANGARNILHIIAHRTATETRFEVIGTGGGGGVSFPIIPPVDVRGVVSTNQTITLSQADGHVTTMTLAGNITITFTGFPATAFQQTWEVHLLQDATGGRTVTFSPSPVETVTIDSGANKLTIITFLTNDGGTNIHAVPTLRGSIDLTGTNFLPLAGGTMAGPINMNGNNFTGAGDYFLADANRDIGSIGTPLDGLFAKRLMIQTGGALSTGETMIRNNAGDMELNVTASTDNYQFFFNGLDSILFSVSGGLNKMDGDQINLKSDLQFQNIGTDPAVNGNMRLNSTDVKIFSGGAVRNISDIGNITGKATTELDNLGTTAVNVDLNPVGNNAQDLGAALNSWAILWVATINMDDFGAVPTASSESGLSISNVAAIETLNLNVKSAGTLDARFDFYFLGVIGMSITKDAAGVITIDPGVLNTDDIQMQPNATNPAVDGVMRHITGGDVKVFSGGALRNFTQMYQKDTTNIPTVNNSFNLGSQSFKFTNIYTDVIRFPETTGDSTTRIGQTAGNLEYRVKQNDAHLFKNVDENMMQIFRTGTTNAKWTFNNTAVFIENVGNSMNIHVPTGENLSLQVQNDDILTIREDLIIALEAVRFRTFSDASRPTPAAAGAGAVFYSNQAGDNFLLYSDGTNWRNVHDNATT